MFTPQMIRMMLSNLTKDPEILAAADLVLAPDSKVEFGEVRHNDDMKTFTWCIDGRKLYRAVAEKDGRKIEAFLVL